MTSTATLRVPAPTASPAPPAPVARRPATLPARVSSTRRPVLQPAIGHGSLTRTGTSLPAHVQTTLEKSFNTDLSSVRVHTGQYAADSAHSFSARAFTFGHNIFLRSGEHSGDLGLMAHETAHVLQQAGGPTVQTYREGSGEVLEREATEAAQAVQRGGSFSVKGRTSSPRVQRWGVGDALDFFAKQANNIPGFRMFTIVLGVNPINLASVESSPANILRAIVEFLPGGGLITQALDNYGVFDKVGKWVGQQIASLGMVGATFKQAITKFLDSLSWKDVLDLGGVWNRAQAIFTAPIGQLITFIKGLVTGILNFIKEAILLPLAKLAEGTEGYNLLKGVLAKDPITGDPFPRSAETLLGPFMKLIGQGEIWENMKKANAIGRCWAWFESTIAQLMAFVSQIPALFVAAFKSLQIEDLILVPKAFAKLANVFGGFLAKFTSWGLNAIWQLLEIIFDVVSPGALTYIKKTGAALKSILQNPLPFVGNLVKAAKLGFENFASNFGTHLKAGLIDWLTGSLPGVYIPHALNLVEIGKFVLSVLGITWLQIRGKIVKALGPNGEKIMKALEVAFGVVVAFVKGGAAAVWDLIKDKLANLKDAVVDGIIGFVTDAVVKKAIPKLISMFIPGAGFISAILSIYDTIMVFVEKLAKIMQVVKSFVDSIVAIAGGAISSAADRVESSLAGLLSLAISFLAGFVGLGKVADKISAVIEKVRATIDKALETAINWIITKAKTLFGKLFGGKGKEDDPEKAKLVAAGLTALDQEEKAHEKDGKIGQEDAEKVAAKVKKAHPVFKSINVVDGDGSWDFEYAASPKNKKKGGKKSDDDGLDASQVESSKPHYGKVDPDRGGSSVTVDRLTPKHKEGSGVSYTPPIMDMIENKRNGKRLYVQGHLLNRLLGGPGNIPENLTPITYSANATHESQAEREVKELVNKKKKAVRYSVLVKYPTQALQGAPNTYEGVLATKLLVSWQELKVISLKPLKTTDKTGGSSKQNLPIENVPPWPQST